MKSGALVFFAAFLALAGSWGGFVLAPQIQLGLNVQTNVVGASGLYPQARPGLAKQGLEVYRASGCMYCHTQQVRQQGTVCEIVLTDAGTNATATHAAIAKFNPEAAKQDTVVLLARLPKVMLTVADMRAAEPALKAVEAAGGKVEARVVAVGDDITRGWGKRRTVAQDYLFDYPVQLGMRRIGPDLANVGARRPDANWHLQHLFAPQNVVKGSTMPPYRFLFTERELRPGEQPSADAIPDAISGLLRDVSKETGPPDREIVPTEDARALVAYLLSLHADAPLFEAPVFIAASSAASTNAPAK